MKKKGQKLRDQDKNPPPELERMVACHIIIKNIKEKHEKSNETSGEKQEELVVDNRESWEEGESKNDNGEEKGAGSAELLEPGE